MSTFRAIGVVGGTSVALVVAMGLTDMGPNFFLVGVLSVLVGISIWALREMNGAVAHPFAPRAITSAHDSSAIQHVDFRVSALRRDLLGGGRQNLSDDRMYCTLLELIDDQLSAAHNVDRRHDPAAAEAIVGAELFTFMSDPIAAHGLSRPRRLSQIVTLIEQI